MSQVRSRLSDRQFILRLVGTVLALALLVYLLAEQGWQEILVDLKAIAPWRLALALGLMIISRIAVSLRWYMLLRSSGMKVTLGQSVRLTFAGLFSNNFLPTTIGGDVVRLAGAVQLKMDATITTASLVVDRLIGMAGMAMMLPFGLPSLFNQSSAIPTTSLHSPAHLAAGLASLPLGTWGRKLADRVLKIILRLREAMVLWLRHPLDMFYALFFTWINMLCLFGFIYVLYAGMGEQVPFLLVGGLYSIVYLVTLLPISINGYGVQELSMTFVFSHFAGVSVSSALTVAVLFRTFMMIASLPGALFLPGILTGGKKTS